MLGSGLDLLPPWAVSKTVTRARNLILEEGQSGKPEEGQSGKPDRLDRRARLDRRDLVNLANPALNLENPAHLWLTLFRSFRT